MASSARLSTILARRGRESTRRRRDRDLKLESLEPRLALATGLLSTLVSVVRDDNSHSLLAPGATAEVAEGTELAASVRLTRKPDSAITVTFKSLAPLEVSAADWYFPKATSSSTTLRFTRANWNQPQAVKLAALQDGSLDGDHRVPVKMTTAVARNPQTLATKKIWIESLDSGLVTPATPVTDTYKGSIIAGSYGGGIQGAYDSVLNRGTVTLKVTMPQVAIFRTRTITVDYSVGPDNRVQVERLQGIPASKFHLEATYRDFGADRGLFGTFTVLQPQLGRSATATMTAAAVPEAVQNLAVAATGAGSLQLSWNPPAGGATSYTVSMNAVSINNGSSTTTSTSTTSSTTSTSMSFTGLSATSRYTFTVTPTAAGNAGPAATTAFQATALVALGENVGSRGITTGSDGSLWVANYGSNTVQQIANVNGSWVAQSPIPVGSSPNMITTALDGSIWVTLPKSMAVQQIVNANGVWTAQPAILTGFITPIGPYAITAGLDGSIWVASSPYSSSQNYSAVQRIVNTNGIWTAQPPIAIAQQAVELTTSSDGSIWASSLGQWQIQPHNNMSGFGGFLKDGLTVWSRLIPKLTPGTTVQQILSINGAWTPQSSITVGQHPLGLAPGSDGSIWVANCNSNTVQQVTSSNGISTAKSAIAVGSRPSWLAAGPDGSIWVINEESNKIQQIVNDGGTWTAQSATSLVGKRFTATGVTCGKDGSAWVSSYARGANNTESFVQQVCTAPLAPENLSASAGPGQGTTTLNWTAPPTGGSPIISYTATVFQGTTSQTITTTSPSCTFSGLVAGQQTYFTVTATTFVGTSPTGSLLIGADGNSLDIGDNVVGIATDGTPFSGGGFDGDGNAYSWEALGSSPTLAWNGVNFQLGGPNQPECTPALGQTIAVPQGAYTQLNLAGAAVNGSQQNQQITLTFTDASTVTWTQSFSDWGSPQNYGHEAIISTQTYRDTASGGTQQFTSNVYGYGYTIPAGKTLASITLPNNKNVRLLDVQMSTSTAVDLSSSYTSWGIANGSTQVANHKGFDGSGNYYYSGNLQSTIAWSGATFAFGPVPSSSSGQNNFVQATGQQIDMPNRPFGWLYLAGAGANGNQSSQQLKLRFSDGSEATWTQSFSDWCSPQNNDGETIIQEQPNRVNQVGNVVSQTNYVYGYAYQVPAGKTLVSVTLPKNSNLGILAMAIL